MSYEDRLIPEYQKRIAVMQAFKEGESIEYQNDVISDWHETSTPKWNWEEKSYRVKPKPIVNWDHVNPVYNWIAKDENGSYFLYTHEPSLGQNAWVMGKVPATANNIRAYALASLSPKEGDWKDSLEKRPKEE